MILTRLVDSIWPHTWHLGWGLIDMEQLRPVNYPYLPTKTLFCQFKGVSPTNRHHSNIRLGHTVVQEFGLRSEPGA